MQPGIQPSLGFVTREPGSWRALAQRAHTHQWHVCWIHPQQLLVSLDEQRPELLVLDAKDTELLVLETCRLIRSQPGGNTIDLMVVGVSNEHDTLRTALYAEGCGLVLPDADEVSLETVWRILAQSVQLRIREDELSRLQDTAARQMEAVQQQRKHYAVFAGTLSHEVRTPLGVIEGFVTNLLDGLEGEISPAQQQSLGIILRNIHRLKQYLGEVLDHSKLEVKTTSSREQRAEQQSPRRVFQRRLLAVSELIDEVVELYREHFRRKGLTLAVEYAEHLPRIWMDRAKIRQVLVNLLSNAHKFTPSGGQVCVKVDCLDEQKRVLESFPTLTSTAGRRKAFLQMSVEDTGIGIAAEDIPGLFAQFVRIEETGIEAEGSGLGLAICKQVIQEHGGDIEMASTVGQGTAMKVILPVDLRRRRLGKVFLFADTTMLLGWLQQYRDNLEDIEIISTLEQVNDMLSHGSLDVLLSRTPDIIRWLDLNPTKEHEP